MAHDAVAVHQAGGLARAPRRAPARRARRSSASWRPARRRPREHGSRLGAVAQLDAVDAAARRGTGRVLAATRVRAASCLAGADDDPVRGRVLGEHEQRLAGGHARGRGAGRRCSGGGRGWRPSTRPRRVHDLAGRVSRRRRGERGTARASVPARKQRSWLSRFSATGSPAARGDLAHLRLGQLAEREPHARERARAAARRACRSGPCGDRPRAPAAAPRASRSIRA